MVSAKRDYAARERQAAELGALLAVLREAGRLRPAAGLVVARIRDRRPGAVRHAPDLELLRRELERCDNPYSLLSIVAETWPELALALLDRAQIKRLHPTLIGGLVRHPAHEAAMIERALTYDGDDGEMVHLFVEAATRHGRWPPIHAAAQMLRRHSDYRPVTETVVRGYATMKDVAAAGRLAVEALLRHEATQPLFALLGQAECPLPDGAVDALARLSNPFRSSHAASELRRAGYAAEARQLEDRLAELARNLPRSFGEMHQLAQRDPARALDLADTIVRDAPNPHPSYLFDIELARFLERVRIDDAGTARRVIGLAQWIRPYPMRLEIEWRAWPYLEP